MTRVLAVLATLLVLATAALGVGGVTGMAPAHAQEPAPAAPPDPAAPGPAPAGAAPEPGAVQGGGSAAEAPRLAPAGYVDLIGEPETLWYAVDALQGQQVAVTVVIRGRPEGVTTTSSELQVAVLDAQLQASGEPVALPFNGNLDTQVQVVGEVLPEVGAEGAYLTVRLASPTGLNDLRDLGYQIEFAIAVGGEPIPLAETQTAAPPTPAAAAQRAEPQPAAASFGDVLPLALVVMAVSGFAAYELMRRRLRRR